MGQGRVSMGITWATPNNHLTTTCTPSIDNMIICLYFRHLFILIPDRLIFNIIIINISLGREYIKTYGLQLAEGDGQRTSYL